MLGPMSGMWDTEVTVSCDPALRGPPAWRWEPGVTGSKALGPQGSRAAGGWRRARDTLWPGAARMGGFGEDGERPPGAPSILSGQQRQGRCGRALDTSAGPPVPSRSSAGSPAGLGLAPLTLELHLMGKLAWTPVRTNAVPGTAHRGTQRSPRLSRGRGDHIPQQTQA